MALRKPNEFQKELVGSERLKNFQQTKKIKAIRKEPRIMKQLRTSFNMVGVIALLALTLGCATTNSNSDLLSAAGFKRIPADTPQKQELLKTLTPGKLSLITWKGKQFYVQPDVPDNLAFVGTPAEYQTYQQLRLARQLSNENLMAAQMNQTAMMGWGRAWGPGFYGGFYGARWR
jgi:hypothetical protein